MTFVRPVAAELRKTITLPASHAAIMIAVLGSFGITLLNALNIRHAIESGQPGAVAYTSPVEAVFSAVPLGTVGAVVLGVVAISSEYSTNSLDAGGGRQITASLTAIPGPVTILVAKAASVVLLVGATAAVTIPACLLLAHLVISADASGGNDAGDTLARAFGAALYWTLTGLMAMAISVLTRSGIIPLIVLIANSSLVSVSLLLSKLTALAYWLPDLAGMRLFARDPDGIFQEALNPLTGALVMTAWALAFLVVAAVVFTRRDA